MTIQDQQYALVYYIENGNPGQILKEIAETEIARLEMLKIMGAPIGKFKRNRTVRCLNKVTGDVYPTITAAAMSINVNLATLKSDIYTEKYNHNIVPI